MKKIKFLIILMIAILILNCKGAKIDIKNLQRGDTIVTAMQSMPNSLNFLIDYNSTSILIGSFLYETLLTRDSETLELKPLLAKKWIISPDKLTYTFILDEDAKWENGSPVTSEDVIFTYNTIMNENNLTGLFRTGYEDEFESVTALDEKTVVFKAKKKRWSVFHSAYGFVVLPKYQFEGKDFNKDFNLNLPAGSGPYRIKEVVPDRYILLERRDDYWGYKLDYQKNYYKFKEIKYKVISDNEIMFEALKKGDIDLMGGGSAAQWYRRTVSEKSKHIEKNWIIPKRIWNYHPIGFQAFYMNLRRDKFKDKRVRVALAKLLNFKLLNEKIMYNQYEKLYSQFPSYFNNNPELPRIEYDPEGARELLKEAGWAKVDSEGFLINEKGERFEISFTYTDQSLEKHLTVYKDDCQRVGIKFNLDLISPSSFRKKVFIDFDYDMTWVAWGTSMFPSIEDVWRGKFANEKNTNNIGGYSNPEVDKLLDMYLEEFDEVKRKEIMKKIDLIIANDVPVILLWTAPYIRIFYWNKFNIPEKYIRKYGDDDDIYLLWGIDKDKEKNLIDAVVKDISLPSENIEFYYDEALIQK
ncbi:MAG TPA: extracellular solute-binding protein [Spirochaetota bacterium]|nr:extracellular solute-binding protein [Spirochaetota bacterium]HOL57292.1 extracellular solute-binding protein [Spirochaetota bacterium]HPP05192.1 extracellular solute-binding protein [Spirochaetota bacterium]